MAQRLQSTGDTLRRMSERRRRYDPDERFPLDADPEDVLRGLLGAEDVPPEEEGPPEDAAQPKGTPPRGSDRRPWYP